MPGRLNGRCRARKLANAVGLVLLAWTARAEGAAFELRWSAPAECPSGAAIVEATRARLGELGSEAPPELFVEGTVQPQSEGFVATLVLSDTSGRLVGERELRVAGQDCAAIEEPVSLVLAMVLATLRPQSGAHAARREQPEVMPPTRAPAAPAEVPMTREVPSRFLMGAGGMTSFGLLPDVGVGATLRAMYSPGSRVYFGLEASFEVGGSARVGTGKIDFQLFGGAARVGLQVFRSRPLELIPTLGARAGVVHAPSSGFARSFGNDTRAIVLAGPGMLGRLRLVSNFFLEVLPEVELVFVRDEFQAFDSGKLYRVHRAYPIDVRLSFGIGYDFR